MTIRRARLCVGLFTLLSAGVARAEDTEDIQSLLSEEVVTTASTTAEKASSAPATSVTISADELQRFGLRTVAEAVDYLSVGLASSDPLRTPDLGARGVLLPGDDGKHFLLLINGHAVNDPLYGAARFDAGAGVPLGVVDHIEVIVGPGSVLYGSSAMLGVINVVTKSGNEYRGGHALAEYEIGRSARVGAGAGFTFDLLGKPAEATATAEYFTRFGPDLEFDLQRNPSQPVFGRPERFRRGGPADGVWGGTVTDSYYVQAPSGIVRVRAGDFEINLMGNLYRRGIPYQTQGLAVDFDSTQSYEMDRAVRFDVKHEAVVSSLVQLTSRLYADSFDYQRQAARQALEGCSAGGFVTCAYYDAGLARWVGVEERLSLNWLSDLSFVTLLGIDARMRWVKAKEDAIDADTGRAFLPTSGLIDESAALVSPYVQQTWSPTHFLDLNAGARLDVDPRFAPQVSPRGAASVSPFRGNTIKAIYSQAFRAPTWAETDSQSYRQAPSGRIQPETVRSLEASVEQRLGTQRLLFGAFRTWWDNLVELTPLSGAEIVDLERRGILPISANFISRYRNVSSLDNYGWNARWDGSLREGHLTYGLSATEAFTRKEQGATSDRLVVAPRLFGNAHVAYEFGGYIPTVGVAAHYVGERLIDRYYVDPRFQVMSPATPLVDLRVTLTGRIPKIAGLGYRASAAYATAAHGPYVAGPGIINADPALTRFPLAPIDRFRVFLGLAYDFGAGQTPASGGE